MRHFLRLFVSFFVATQVCAGSGWNSGGGQIVKDANNP
jgi:hypothetical protein